ncbi:MAG: hypothetical protein Q9197_005210, partial [Variospora fuerteventurae]
MLGPMVAQAAGLNVGSSSRNAISLFHLIVTIRPLLKALVHHLLPPSHRATEA